MTAKRFIKGYVCVLLMFAMSGCGTDSTSMSVPIDPAGWKHGSMRVLRFHNTDTVSLRDITLFVVYDNRAAEAENCLDMEIEVHSPGGTKFNENVKVAIDRPDEKNIIRQSSTTYRRGVRLIDSGEYRIILKNRNSLPIRGVRAAGIEITESENGKRQTTQI